VIQLPQPYAIAPLLLSTLLLGVGGGFSGGTEKDFEESLQIVDRTIASGKGKKAKELLLAAIDASQGQPFALYHLTEIQDDLSRATFWSTNEKPDPKTLVSGELMSWSPASGQIKLRYRLGSEAEKPGGKSKGTGADHGTWTQILGDFTKEGAVWVHPLSFDGPFTIEIKGSSYPAMSDPPRVPFIAVCATWNESTIVSFGLAPARVDRNVRYVPARIVHVEGGESSTLAEEQMNVLPGQPYDVKVVVAASSVTGFLNETKLVTAARSGSFDGRFAFENFPNVSEILVNGKAQPSWLSNVVDTAVQERWSAFEKGYKSVDDLPAWLREKVLGGADAEKKPEDAIPGEDTLKGKERAAAFLDLIKAGKRQEALEFAEKIPAADVSEETRAWLEAFALNALGREREALAAYDKVCALDPKFLPARRMKVVLERGQRSLHEAIEDGKRVVADFPKESGPYVDLANLHLLEGRPEDAEALVRSAIDAGIPAGTLEEAQHLVTRALRGPLWSKAFEYKSEHYTVSSDINQRICFEAASLLEKFYTKFNLHLRHVPPQEKRVFRVFLFSGRAGYDAYTRDLIGQEKKNTAGLYSGLVKQLLIWNLPDFENMMRTIRHEGFHQYLDRLTSDAPVWLNEGLAEYYEGSKLVKGAWSDGEIQGAHLETLAKSGLVPLAEFVHIRPAAFYSEKLVHEAYAEAWAFVHFLLSSGPENKKVFDQLLDLLLAGTKQADAIDQVFTNATLPRLEQEFASYVRRLK
jgi:tetratricopeptide (TPR) repeat protein